ncbi:MULTISPECIES: hypothetical protein [Sorangium]|nr:MULTISPECIES: hypothetical protein [Sorangium]
MSASDKTSRAGAMARGGDDPYFSRIERLAHRKGGDAVSEEADREA